MQTLAATEVAEHAPGVFRKATTLLGVVGQGVAAARDNKIGRYTDDYKSRIAAANAEAVASAASYMYANPNNTSHGYAQDFINSNLPGYEIDRSLSDAEHIVLRNDATKQAMVAFRGTDVGVMDDLNADVQLAAHGTDYTGLPRFDKALERFEQAKAELGGYAFSVTGHSLGGSQAMWVARHHPSVTAKVFNPGITWHNGKQNLKKQGKSILGNLFHMRDKTDGQEYNNIEILRMDGDVVSSGYVSRVGFEETLGGEQLSKNGHLLRPYGHNGAKLVNAKYENTEDHGVSWTLKAHALQNFLTEEQSLKYRDLSRISKEAHVYGDSDGNSSTGNSHFKPAEAKRESHTQMTGKMRTGNAYHHHAHTASIDI